MKLIKILISLSMLNALFVIGISAYLSSVPVPLAQQKEDNKNPPREQSALDTSVFQREIIVPSQIPKSTDKVRPSVNPTVTPIASQTPAPIAPKPTATPTPTPTSTPISTSTPAPATPTPAPKPVGCVIKIDGVSYEITSLRRSHSGGDIFTCNTDMSTIFWGEHNQKIWQKMQAYRI